MSGKFREMRKHLPRQLGGIDERVVKKEVGDAVEEAVSESLSEHNEDSPANVTINKLEVHVQVNSARGGGATVNVKNA